MYHSGMVVCWDITLHYYTSVCMYHRGMVVCWDITLHYYTSVCMYHSVMVVCLCWDITLHYYTSVCMYHSRMVVGLCWDITLHYYKSVCMYHSRMVVCLCWDITICYYTSVCMYNSGMVVCLWLRYHVMLLYICLHELIDKTYSWVGRGGSHAPQEHHFLTHLFGILNVSSNQISSFPEWNRVPSGSSVAILSAVLYFWQIDNKTCLSAYFFNR